MKIKFKPTEKVPLAFYIPLERRRFLRSLALASAGFSLPGFLAEALTLTPTVTQGPYYPLATNIPLDKDNDLVQLNDHLTTAAGVITQVSGRVLTATGDPINGALVELWHADREGDYLYSGNSTRNAACDANFAGFGQYLTGRDGRFRFRTVKAGLYPGRTRHYHWGVTIPGQLTRVTSQTGWNEVAKDLNGHTWATQNLNDNVFSSVTTSEQRAAILLDYLAVPGTTTGEVHANWDYVVNQTPAEPTYPGGGSLVVAGKPVAGLTAGSVRYEITIPGYVGYSYEIYGNPTFADLTWAALPFALGTGTAADRNIYTATTEGSLKLYVDAAAERGFYYVGFRVPGANTGTPGGSGGGGPGGPPPR